jgi:DNA-binding NtrC family response regulator
VNDGGEPPAATAAGPGPLDLAALTAGSPALAAALAGIDRAAASDAPLLILGEAGTGRSTVARAIHRASPRGTGPLVEVDPGSLPATLFEAELFGWRAGAFTGADRDQPGRVARAAGGSLLLDHVEELPVAAQPKLLRLVAERRFAPLGGRELEADVRFLAVGPDDLLDRVDRRAFRSDLYYRLGVLTFRLPSLRERRDELPVLAARLLADLGLRFGRSPAPVLAADAIAWMRRHSWPGNLIELRHLLERELILGVTGGEAAASLSPAPPAGSGEERPPSLVEVERRAILRALAYTRGRQGRAAEILGISRKALWEKRKRLGIP